MMADYESFDRAIDAAAHRVLAEAREPFVILHHNDADGIGAGAILYKAFDRLSARPSRVCLEKPYPAVMKRILEEESNAGGTLVVTDFGSGMLPTIVDLNGGRMLVVVLDHHTITPAHDSKLVLVNPLEHGISAMRDCSGATVAYLFARALSVMNEDLAALAILGAAGDGMISTDALAGELHVRIAAVARRFGHISPGLPIEWARGGLPLRRIVKDVNALGSFGYFSNGPDIAVKGVLEEFDERYTESARRFQEWYDKELAAFLSSAPLERDGKLVWFALPESFERSGVKTVGLVCEELVARGLVGTDEYVAGFQRVPDRIPGFGPIVLDQTKISMRVGKSVRSAIERDGKGSLAAILPAVTRAVGGFVDACHPHAAATTVANENVTRFVELLRREVASEGVR